MSIDEKVFRFPKNFGWETNGQIAELIKQAEGALPHLEENSVGYYYYWMLQELKKLAAKTEQPVERSHILESRMAFEEWANALTEAKMAKSAKVLGLRGLALCAWEVAWQKARAPKRESVKEIPQMSVPKETSLADVLSELVGPGFRILESSDCRAFGEEKGLTIQMYRPDWDFGVVSRLAKKLREIYQIEGGG